MKPKSSSLPRCVPIAALAVALLAASSTLHAAGTFTWDGGNGNGSWPNLNSWDPNGSPTSDNQTDLVFNTNVQTTNQFIGSSRIARSLTYGANIDSLVAVSFNFFNSTSANLTMQADSGNASINVDADAAGNIILGFATDIGSNPGNLVLGSFLNVVHNGSGVLTFNRGVTGTNGIIKTGTGTLQLGGLSNNTYTGLTTVSNGVVMLNKATTFDAIAGNVLVNGTGVLTNSASDQIKDTANVEVAAGSWKLAGNSETVNNVKLTGGSITSTTGVVTSTTAYDFQSGSATAILAGSAGANKTGAGTVTLSGTNANTYIGATVVTGGTLELNKTASVTALAGSVEVGTGAKLLISASEQVANSAAVTLSGGTIERGAGVSETFGNLNLTAASFLDYGTGATGTLTFGTYSPSLKLTVNNFLLGNVLRFTSDLSGSINNTSLFAFSNGFVSDWNTTTPGFFTITSIPEPSTYAAAIGLLGLMLWSPLRRRLRPAR